MIASGPSEKDCRSFYESVKYIVIDICERESAPGNLNTWGDSELAFTTFLDVSLRAVLLNAAPDIEEALKVRRGGAGGGDGQCKL